MVYWNFLDNNNLLQIDVLFTNLIITSHSPVTAIPFTYYTQLRGRDIHMEANLHEKAFYSDINRIPQK